jgi:hypothetical protein
MEDSDNTNINNDLTVDIELSENRHDGPNSEMNDDSLIFIDKQQYDGLNITQKCR